MATLITKNGLAPIELSVNDSHRKMQMRIATRSNQISFMRFRDKQGKPRIMVVDSNATVKNEWHNVTASALTGQEIYGFALMLTVDETEDEGIA